MPNMRHKPPDQLVNPRGGRGRGVTAPGRPPGWRMPSLPREVTQPLTDPVQARYQPEAVRHARAAWRDWWNSLPANAVDIESDGESIRWWIICVFRRALYLQIVREQPLVKGSMGQVRKNPLEAVIVSLTADINRAEAKFGMNTLDRFRLGITEAYAQRSLADLMQEEDRPTKRPSLADLESMRVVSDE